MCNLSTNVELLLSFHNTIRRPQIRQPLLCDCEHLLRSEGLGTWLLAPGGRGPELKGSGREPAAGKGGTRETAAKIGGAGQLAAAAWRPRTKADAETRRLAREGRGRRRRAVTGDLGWAVKRT